MSDEKLNADTPAADSNNQYEAPAIEEVVKREDIEREVAYAGVIGGSHTGN